MLHSPGVLRVSSGGFVHKTSGHDKLPHGNNKCNSARVLKRRILADLAISPWQTLEQFHPDCTLDTVRFAHGTTLQLLATARHVASLRLVSQAHRLGLAWQLRLQLL